MKKSTTKLIWQKKNPGTQGREIKVLKSPTNLSGINKVPIAYKCPVGKSPTISLAADVTGKGFVPLQVAVLVLLLHVRREAVDRGEDDVAQLTLEEYGVFAHRALYPDTWLH